VACSHAAPARPFPPVPSPQPAAWSSAGVPPVHGRSSAGAAVATRAVCPSPRRGPPSLLPARRPVLSPPDARPWRPRRGARPWRGSPSARPGRPSRGVARPTWSARPRPRHGSQRATWLLAATLHGLLAARLRCRSRWPRASWLPARRGPPLLGASVAHSSAPAWLPVACSAIHGQRPQHGVARS
jgi:hypothetical protein